MKYWLLQHYFLKKRRAPKLTGAQLYIVGIGAFIVIGLFFLFAASAESIAAKFFHEARIIPFVIILTYALLDFAIRVIAAPYTFAPFIYYTLPIPKWSYVFQSLLLTLFSVFNVAALIFFLFYLLVFTTVQESQFINLCLWYTFLILSGNFLAFALKRWPSYLIFIFILLVVSMPILIMQDIGISIFFLLDNPIFAVLTTSVSLIVCALTTYLSINQEVFRSESGLKFNLHFGFKLKSPLLWQEIMLIIRNKRPRGLILSFFLLIPYFYFIFHDQVESPLDNVASTVFVFLFLVAGLPIQYGYLGLAWECGYLELLLSLSDFKAMIKSKFKLLIYLSTASFILICGFAFWRIELLPIIVASYALQLSIGNYMLLYYMVYNDKPIDINKSSFFNYQGVSSSQIFMPLIILAIQYIFLLMFTLLLGVWLGSAIVTLAGILAFYFRSNALEYIMNKWNQKKFYLLNNYRKQ